MGMYIIDSTAVVSKNADLEDGPRILYYLTIIDHAIILHIFSYCYSCPYNAAASNFPFLNHSGMF